METMPEKSVAALINANFKAMKSVLPKHMTPERMARIALIEVRRTPKLAQADPATLVGAILVASQLGLEPGPQGFAYLIPYWNKDRKCFEVNFQLGYRGMMDLARRSGGVGMLTAEAVRENDEFSYRLGTDPSIHHIPATGDRGPITHFYSIAKLVPSGHVQFRVMELSEVEKVRDLHSKANQGGFSPWKTHFEDMGLKTLIRRNCKYLPTSPEVQKAISLDEMGESGIDQNLAAELPFDMEIPADFENEAAANQMESTAAKIKRDLENTEGKPMRMVKDDLRFANEEPAAVDESDMVPDGGPDDFDLMDGPALDNWLANKKETLKEGMTKNLITSALKSDSVTIKRELARRIAND